MTPLEELIRERILEDGAISVAGFMAACLGHPDHGYYMKKDPFGADGDFVTAPEISQMFGELLGLWILAGWQAAGSPAPFSILELGPGRGTLMADALRAASGFPAFQKAARIHFVETSPTLREAQERALAQSGFNPLWHSKLSSALAGSEGPLFIIANEFLDALPVHQFILTDEGWREKVVALGDGGELVFALAGNAPQEFVMDILRARSDTLGATAEFCPSVVGLVREISAALVDRGGMALFIDYGHEKSAPGDTLQAVKGHDYVSPLIDPGEVDITAHVDFEAVARAAHMGGASPFGPLGQGAFLKRIGIDMRAEKLVAGNPGHSADIKEALDRLTSESRMGTLFKAMALAPAGVMPPGFEEGEIFVL